MSEPQPQRYACGRQQWLERDELGTFVLYTDYAKLADENKRLRECFNDIVAIMERESKMRGVPPLRIIPL